MRSRESLSATPSALVVAWLSGCFMAFPPAISELGRSQKKNPLVPSVLGVHTSIRVRCCAWIFIQRRSEVKLVTYVAKTIHSFPTLGNLCFRNNQVPRDLCKLNMFSCVFVFLLTESLHGHRTCSMSLLSHVHRSIRPPLHQSTTDKSTNRFLLLRFRLCQSFCLLV